MNVQGNLDFIVVGRVLAPWGINGMVKAQILTDFPQRFRAGATVFINRQPITISSVSTHKGQLHLKLESVDSMDDALKMRGRVIEIPESELQELPEGQYYCHQLIGLEVRTTGGDIIGKIKDVLNGANDVYVVDGAKGEVLIPAVEEVVKSVDIPGQTMIIEPVPGLLGLNEKAAK